MKNLCTFVCLFAATTLTTGGGVVASKSVPLGSDPVNMQGDVVNSAGKSNRLIFMPVLPADGGQVVNRFDKVDRYDNMGPAQIVARNHKADPVRTTLSMRVLAHYTSSRTGSNDTERVVSNLAGKTDRLTGVVLAQAVERGWKADMMYTTVASLEPAVSAPVQTTVRKSGTQTGVSEHRAPLVFVPVTLVYDQQASNLAEFTPENAATKTLWN